jgi:uncharacterized protein
MSEYKIPGVYIEEQSVFPPSVSATATAVPAFLGYTSLEVADPQKIQSMMEFEAIFGLPPVSAGPAVTLSEDPNQAPVIDWAGAKNFHLYYYVEHYFRNGGGPCYVISTGVAGAEYPTDADGYIDALDVLKKLDEPTLIILTDAMATLEASTGDYAARHASYFSVLQAALLQCGTLKDRFVIVDMPDAEGDVRTNAPLFRGAISSNPSYAAAYYPYLETSLSRRPIFTYGVTTWRDTATYSSLIAVKNKMPVVSYNGPSTPSVEVKSSATNPAQASFSVVSTPTTKVLTLKLMDGEKYTATQISEAFDRMADKEGFALTSKNVVGAPADHDAVSFVPQYSLVSTVVASDISQLKSTQPTVYAKIAAAIAKTPLRLPPAPAMAGIYASVDRDRGVWKSPANVGLSATNAPATLIGRDDQAFLDVDDTNGRSINCILNFTGKGVIPWGARTLDGSNLDWRYISVRRLFIMVEESVKKAAQFAVFEPNDKNTWSKVKAMIGNFLFSLWQKGALTGGKPEEAYFVQVGLGETMSAQDVLEGRMIIQVGLAAVRPAEFIIVRFSQIQQNA